MKPVRRLISTVKIVKMAITKTAVERDQWGYWQHPDYYPYTDLAGFSFWLSSNELECCAVAMLDEILLEFYEMGCHDCLPWAPAAPAGEGWFIGAIQETKKAPVCVWLRSMMDKGEVMTEERHQVKGNDEN